MIDILQYIDQDLRHFFDLEGCIPKNFRKTYRQSIIIWATQPSSCIAFITRFHYSSPTGTEVEFTASCP